MKLSLKKKKNSITFDREYYNHRVIYQVDKSIFMLIYPMNSLLNPS